MATTFPPEDPADGASVEDHGEDAGAEPPVRAAYEGMCRSLAGRLDVDAETHRELVAGAAAAGVDGDALAGLRRVTRIYERVVYADESVPAPERRWAVEVATALDERLR